MAQKLYRVKGVDLAKVATVVAHKGGKQELTPERLGGLAKRYNPAKHEACVVIGHTDEQTAPSFGVVENPRFEGDTLYGDYAGLTESAALDFTRLGSYPRRSIEITVVDGEEYLGDVAQIGARRPAIKGLKPVTLAQIEPMTPEECLAFAEAEPASRSTYDPTGFLFSEEPTSIPTEEPNMAGTDVQLAEENGALKAQLAERDAALAEKDAKLAEAEQREALALAEAKLTEARVKALAFAEGEHIKPKLGAVEPQAVAGLIAQAKTRGYQTAEGQCFGEAIEKLLSEMPAHTLTAGGADEIPGGKVEGDATLGFSERVQETLDDLKKQHGEDSEPYKAALAAAQDAARRMAA